MTIPVILYNINNEPLTKTFIAKSNSFFIKSFQFFGIKLINNLGNNKIYSVTENPTPTGPDDLLIIQNNTEFSTVNFGYTLYLESDAQIMVWNASGQNVIYNIKLINENAEPEHYNDLLINNGLPNYIELLPAIISENKAEIIKRLLLDFKNIVKYKGTITGITKFLNLIGFNPESIKVYAEFITPAGIKTINPDKLVDKKTGDYHLIYENYSIDADDKYTLKNLPKFTNSFNDLEEFFEKLFYAISLANIYFTLPEQDISFFGIKQIANSEQYLSIAGRSYVTHYQNPHWFIKNIDIQLTKYYTENVQKHIVKHNILTDNYITEASEVKFKRAIPVTNTELFVIDEEIFDSEEEQDFDVKSIFGNLLHLKIDSLNTYVKYRIEKIGNELTKIENYLFVGEQPVDLKYIATLAGNYRLTVWITDYHNNQEKYVYDYIIDANIADIDFDIYNSAVLGINNELLNGVSSNDFVSETTENYVLPEINIPTLLSEYYDVDISGITDIQFMGNNNKYMLPEINKNFVVDKCTEIPIDLMDNWLNVLAFKLFDGYKLMLRHVDPVTNVTLYSEISDTTNIENTKELFVTEMLISESVDTPENTEMYLFVSTQTIGIDIVKELWDLVLVNVVDDAILSIYDLPDFTKTKIPVNFDFPLFHREYDGIIPENNYPDLPENDDPLIRTVFNVKSIFPKLTKESFTVKLGDVIASIPNKNYIVGQYNILWEIRNGFTNELLHSSTDLMLKYRVTENTIYNITLKFKIGNADYQVVKQSIVSSL